MYMAEQTEPALPRLRQALGPDHPEMAQAMASYARLQRAEKDYAGAERTLHEALDIARRKLGPEHAVVAGFELDLGQVLALSGRCAEAEPLLQRGFASAEAAGNNRNARRAAEKHMKLYHDTRRPDAAEASRQKLAAILSPAGARGPFRAVAGCSGSSAASGGEKHETPALANSRTQGRPVLR